MPRLFEKAYRGSAAAGVTGSGLGLYMAKAVIEVHGGTLTVENLPESGKKFRIWLPIAA
jgi:signal transduction histidine kinase